MLAAVLLLFAAAAAAPWLHRAFAARVGWVLALAPAALFVWFAAQLAEVTTGAPLREVYAWVPALGVRMTFVLDGLALLFALLVTGLGALVVVYAAAYLKGHPQLGRFLLFLLGFMGSMLGVVLADNLLALFVFWELTSICSYLLIGFDHEKEKSREAALQALLVTGTGGLALLGGFLLLGHAAGTLEISAINAAGGMEAHALYLPILLLVVLGAFTKSAQVPFHFWLPNAMAAPTPVSAYLHSATMVKAGIYLLMRLDPSLGGSTAWTWLLGGAGMATMLTGAVLAMAQTDLKRVLAYSTLTALGTLTLLLGLGFDASVKAALVFLVVHALYKGALFLVAGSVDHETGTRDVLQLGGLRRAMPWTAAAAVLAGLSMAGLPPLFGFIAKELSYKAKLGFAGGEFVLPALALLANALTFAAAGLLVARPFFGAARPTPRAPHEAPTAMLLGPLVLASTGLVLGLMPGSAVPLVASAARAVAGADVPINLSLWYGPGVALALSGATVALGVAFYLGWERVRGGARRAERWLGAAPEAGYRALLDGTLRLAGAQTRFVQGGGLRTALATVFAVTVVLAGSTLVLRHGVALPAWPDARPHEWLLALLVGSAAVAAAVAPTRLSAALALGAGGFGVALLFLVMGAPDLAITQLLVETLIVVVILLVLQRLPRFDATVRLRAAERVRGAALALGMGGLAAALVLAVTRVPLDRTVADFYAAESVPGGFGRNVVNVILVDFRALDTLGEITVLAIAALGAVALLGMRRGRRAALPPRLDSLILRTVTPVLVPLLLLMAAFLVWRGHNLPGGGFIGGLVAAGAFVLLGVARGPAAARRALRVEPRTLMAAGIGTAVLSGCFALLGGDVFMAGQWTAVGAAADPLKLGTPLLFDIGVFLTVVGFSLATVLALEE